MRGQDTQQSAMFSYVSPEDRVPAKHPLRSIRRMADEALKTLSPVFDRIYATFGRPSIAPEELLRALLLQVLYTIRGVLDQANAAGLTSDEHFSVDGTLIEAWASQKSFQRKDQAQATPPDDPGNPTVSFHGEKRRNDTHESNTDPEARLARKSGGHESKLAYCGNLLIENRNGLVVDTELTQCSGTAERDAAVQMVERIEGVGRATLAADKGYDTRELVSEMRARNVTPHVAQNLNRQGGSAIDARTTRHPGYQVSQRKRKRIEEVFGWLKTVGMLREFSASLHKSVGIYFSEE